MVDNNTATIILGIAAVLAVAFLFYSKWQDGKSLDSALLAVKEMSAAKDPNALIEKAMTSVVPRESLDQAIEKINSGAQFIETFTPDKIDQLVEALRKYGISLIDGQPNVPPDTSVNPPFDAEGAQV